MAYTAKQVGGNYEIYENGQRISTGSKSILGNYGLSEANLGSAPAPVVTPPSTQSVVKEPVKSPTPTTTGQTHIVKAGDNISTIAANYGVNPSDISGYRSGNQNLIYPGEVLTVGKKATTQSSAITPPPDTSTSYSSTTKTSDSTIPGEPTVDQAKARQAEIERINAEANSSQGKDFSSIKDSLGNNVDQSDSSRILKALVTSFETNQNTNKAPSLVESFNTQRANLGVGTLETNLSSVDAEMAKLDSDFSALNETESNRSVSVLQINRRKSQEQTQYENAKRELNLKRTGIVNELKQKYDTIDSIMKYTSADYDNAQQSYTTQFNQAISLTNLIKGIEETQKSDAEKKVDNARANLQIMLTASKGRDFSTLDPALQTSIKSTELQAGLPTGFFQFLSTSVTDPVVSIGGEYTDASGNRQVPIYTKNPDTGVMTVKVVSLPGGTQQSSTDKNQNEANDIASAILDFKKQIETKGWKGINPDAYAYYKAAILKTYGADAVLKFDKAITDAALSVDNGK